MIDLHSHILPGIDDGAKTLGDSLEMARVAAADGITAMAVTPHSAELLELDLRAEPLARRIADLQAAIDALGISLRLYPGAELFAEPGLVERIRDGRLGTLNHSRYVLIEAPMSEVPRYFDTVIFELQAAGYVPIIAHPERNRAVIDNPSHMITWASRGALNQVTAGSLTGGFGRRVQQLASLAVRRQWIHLLASDTHGPRSRPPKMSPAYAAVADLVGGAVAQTLCTEVPARIVADEAVELPTPLPADQAPRGFFGRLFGR